MYLYDVIPIIKLPLVQPQILTYYSSRTFPDGSLVLISLGKMKTIGLIKSNRPLSSEKINIKKAAYPLKNILKSIAPAAIIAPQQIKLALWLSDYYWSPLGPIVKMMIPKKLRTIAPLSQKILNSLSMTAPNKQKQTLILAPELAQITPLLEKMPKNKRSGIVVLHGELTSHQHFENWLKIKNGQSQIVIGTRSAVLAPFNNLRQIIIENEENPRYKSTEQNPRLDGRQAAEKLAELFEAKLEKKSDTPRLETYHQLALAKKSLPLKMSLAPTLLINLKKEWEDKRFSLISRPLQENLRKILKEKKQAILFVGRKAAATLIICQDCGYFIKCPNCEAALVYQLAPNARQKGASLICRYCRHSETPPALCPICQGHRLKFAGWGTEKIELAVKNLFPAAAVGRLDGDLPPEQQQEVIRRFEKKEISLLVATQSLFGYQLSASLVAALTIDILLRLPDFRATERAFRLLRQLNERAEEIFIIQTQTPDNYAIAAAKHQPENFYQQELHLRQQLRYPPFSQLIKLTYRHYQEKIAEKEAQILAQKLKSALSPALFDEDAILGPWPAFIPKKRGYFAQHIVLKIRPDADLTSRNELLKIVPANWAIDVDPESLL